MALRGGDGVNRLRFPTGQSDALRTSAPWTAAPWQQLTVYEGIADPAEPPDVWARDLLMLANAAFVADRMSHYPGPADLQREIRIDVPLAAPDSWKGQPIELLARILGYLSGDLWSIEVRAGAVFHPTTQQQLHERWRAAEVAVLSGGVDSTAGGAQIAARSGGDALFLSYHHQAMDAVQTRVFQRLKNSVAQRPVHRVRVESRLESGTVSSDDSQFRTRGLRFIGTGVYLAAAHGVDRLLVPENGQLALNPPLTASRAGAWSTRSMHPMVLQLLNELIRAVGGAVEVVNPLMDLTKGEVCRLALRCGLTEADLMLTNSCSKPASNLGGATHCGACFACLVRRSGFLAAGISDSTDYLHGFGDDPLDGVLEENLRAIELWLSRDFTLADLLVDLPLPAGTADRILPVIVSGRTELEMLISQADAERVRGQK